MFGLYPVSKVHLLLLVVLCHMHLLQVPLFNPIGQGEGGGVHIEKCLLYFWLKVRNFVAYENHASMPVYVTLPLQYENL